MLNIFFVFLIFAILSVVFRFIIGNPIHSSRMQTKYKFKSIPNIANILLFYNTNKRPVSIHVIVFQIQNYIVFLISILLFSNDIDFYKDYFVIEGFMGFFIVILPLFIETIVNMIVGEHWKSVDGNIELSFDNYTISFFSEEASVTLVFGIYFKNRIVFLNDDNVIAGEGTIDCLNKKIILSKSSLPIPNLQLDENTICFSKNND